MQAMMEIEDHTYTFLICGDTGFNLGSAELAIFHKLTLEGAHA